MRMNVYVRWTVWGFNRSNRKLDDRETETEIERQTNGKESETDWQIEIAESWEKEWEREREGSRERSRTRFHRNCSFVVDRRTNRSIHRLLIIPKTRNGGRNLIFFLFSHPLRVSKFETFEIHIFFFSLFKKILTGKIARNFDLWNSLNSKHSTESLETLETPGTRNFWNLKYIFSIRFSSNRLTILTNF